jgi:hypothetical protein
MYLKKTLYHRFSEEEVYQESGIPYRREEGRV